MNGAIHDVGRWDLLVAHPPCTYLSNAGAGFLWKGKELQADRVMKGIQGLRPLYEILVGRYPKNLYRESGAEQGILPAGLYANHSAI